VCGPHEERNCSLPRMTRSFSLGLLKEPVHPFAPMALAHRHAPGGGRIGLPRIEEQEGLHPFGSPQARVRTP